MRRSGPEDTHNPTKEWACRKHRQARYQHERGHDAWVGRIEMVLANSLQEDIGDDATGAAKQSSERTGKHGIARLHGKATIQPDDEEASWDQHDPGQLRGEKAKLVMQLILRDKVRLCDSNRDEQSSYQTAGGKPPRM
jgi:hypothetical protein